ncbi:hypothetical protein R3P38DRAFT_3452607 [Favolaschia claudopus]|uniref:Uncharacterized protein n=1 Tax=Favolaschia claudopus TaxID=2862362 RepID=A0AAV9ZJP5_9AGAR
MPLTTLSGDVFLVVPSGLAGSPDCSMTSRRAVIKDCKVEVPSFYTRSGEPLFYLSESEESSETQSSGSSETETDDDGSDAMDTDNDPSLYEFDPTDSDREQFHKPDPFPPREKFPFLFNASFGQRRRQPHRCGCGERTAVTKLEPPAPRAWGDGMREDEPKTETPRRGQPKRPRLTHKRRRLPNYKVA